MTRPKPFICPACDKGFKSASARAMHMNDVHSGPEIMIEPGRKNLQKPRKTWLTWLKSWFRR